MAARSRLHEARLDNQLRGSKGNFVGSKNLYWNDEMEKTLTPYIEAKGGLAQAVTFLAQDHAESRAALRLPTEELEITSSVETLTDRWRTLMALENRALRALFTRDEVNLMLNNALSTIYAPAGVIPGAVLASTEDEDQAVFKKFQVDKGALLTKLKGLSPAQDFALVDWLETLRDKLDT